ncbi:MAG: hypothetical protein Q8S73_36850 [Deltaproteobacteria bacterium]|nr:hypothetical protein [Myxococcales bacterium]MDP3219729.1 hypothetical protein [Deltaproteobacteria bacterium]
MDDDRQARAERQWLIPSEVVLAAQHNPHLHTAVTMYVASGDTTAWRACFDALQGDVARLTGECERRGLVMTLPIDPWPEGVEQVDALTSRQATALVHAAEAHRLLMFAATRLNEVHGVPSIELVSTLQHHG